ncbi:patched domain-containing protein 3-like [Centruroides vittatus]|uniref:patched domain-containing protein 3-like n=1 Tax=Centruroides vittatus TaxID=120091 RepID=UPI00350F2AD7
MDLHCIQRGLSSSFKLLGRFIGKYPKWFIVLSVISSFIISLGNVWIKFETEFHYLFSPINARAYEEREIVEKLFPSNRSVYFDFIRMTDQGRFASAIVIPKDGGSILRKEIFQEILKLDGLIQSINVTWKNVTYNFNHLCAKNYGVCQDNNLLEYEKNIHYFSVNKFYMKFPAAINLQLMDYNLSAINLGGVKVDENGFVLDAKAFRLFYFLDNSDPFKDHLDVLFEKEFLKAMTQHTSDNLTITKFVSSSFNEEIWQFSIKALKLSPIPVCIIVTFSVLSSISMEFVRSKPWLGLAGCILVPLATLPSFGFVIFCGFKCTPVNIIVPFLILGIGVDDAFVLIAAWRRTNPKDNVQIRMGETYSEAAMSVTITSLTNCLSFMIGLITPFPIVRNVCTFATSAIIFTYIYQITFFGGCMALSGYREEKKLHPITFKKVIPMREAGNKGYIYKLLFTEGLTSNSTGNPPKLMIWCRDKLGGWMIKISSKIIIFSVYITVLTTAIYGITILKEGIEYGDIFPTTSYASSYAINYNRYFTEYPHALQLVIRETMDYSKPKVQSKVLNVIQSFQNSTYIEENYITSWLTYYLYFIKEPRFWFYKKSYNFSDPEDFVHCLRNVFLRHPVTKMFERDIVFDEDGIRISASRFIFPSKNVNNTISEKNMMATIRARADAASLPVTVHNFWWIDYEQLLVAEKLTIQSIVIAASTVVLVFFLFMPNLACVICIMFNIVSIQICILGYMAFWNVTLNPVSVIILIVSIGLSVDYSAHISYSYLEAKKSSIEDRIKHCLFASAMPIIQGTLSTFFSVMVTVFIPSYIFLSFFKIMFLLVVFSFLHGLFIIPVFLSFMHYIVRSLTSKNKNRTKNYSKSTKENRNKELLTVLSSV